jgi:hypothetical protein
MTVGSARDDRRGESPVADLRKKARVTDLRKKARASHVSVVWVVGWSVRRGASEASAEPGWREHSRGE